MALSYTTKWASFQASGTGSWVSYDLYTNQSVPKGAVAEIIVANANASAEVVGGVRKKGSSLTRSIALHEAEAGGLSHCRMFVQTDASDGTIEVYAGDTNIYFRLIAYWEGVTFTELASQITLATASAWTDATISDGVANQVHHMIFLNNEEATNNCGIRAKSGSPIGDRYILMHEAESGGSVAVDFIVKTDGSKYIQYYTPDTTNTSLYCYGYFSSDMDYVEDDRPSVLGGTVTGWRQDDLSAYMDQDGRVVDLYCFHEDTLNEINVGARNGDDSTTNRYVLEQETEGGGRAGASFSALSNATGLVYLYRGSITASYVYFMGYFKPGQAYEYAAGTMSGTGTLAAKASVKKRVAGTMSGAGTLAAIASVRKRLTCAMSGVGTLAAAPQRIRGIKATPLLDDFEWGSDGDSIGNDGGRINWTVSTGGSSKCEIDTDQKYDGTRSMLQYMDGTNYPWARMDKTAESFKYRIVSHIRITAGAGWTIYHGDGVAYRIRFYVSSSRELRYRDHAGADIGTDIYLTAGQWYALELTELDFSGGYYNVMLDNNEVLHHIEMEGSTSSANIIYWGSGGSFNVWADRCGVLPSHGRLRAAATKLGVFETAAGTMSGVGNFSAAGTIYHRTPQPMLGGSQGQLINTASPSWSSITGSLLFQTTAENREQCPLPTGGIFRGLRVKLSAAPTGNAYTFTLRKNGADTSLTVTVGVGETEAICSDSTEVHFNAGDLVAMKVSYSSAPTNRPYARWGTEWVPDIPNEFIILGNTYRSDIVDSYGTPWEQNGTMYSTDYTAWNFYPGDTGVLKKWRGFRATAPGSGNTERWYIHYDAADSSLYFDIADSATTGYNDTTEITVPAITHCWCVHLHEQAGACGASYVGWGMVYVPTNGTGEGEPDHCLPWTFGFTDPPDGYYYQLLSSADADDWSSSEFPRMVNTKGYFTWMDISFNGAIEAGITITLILMKNGSETSLQGSWTTGSYGGHVHATVPFTQGDLLSLHAHVSGGVTGRSGVCAFRAFHSKTVSAAAAFSGVGNMAAAATEIVPVIVSAAASFSGAGNLVGALTNRGVLTKQVLFGGNGDTVNPSDTEYCVLAGMSPWWGNNRVMHEQVFPCAGKLRCLEIETGTATTTNPYTYTVMKNGSPTSLAVTVANGSTTGRNDNESDVVEVAAGDLLCLRAGWSSTPDVAPLVRWSTIFIPNSNDWTMVLGGGYCVTAPTRYGGVQNQSRVSSMATSDYFGARSRWPVSGQLANLYVYLTVTDTDVETFTLYKNGVATSLVASVTNGVATPDTVHTVDVAAGDYLQMQVSDSSTIPNPTVSWAMTFKATVRGQCVYTGSTSDDPAADEYHVINGARASDVWNNGWNSMSMNAAPAINWKFKKFMVYQDTAPGSGTGRTFAFNKAGTTYLAVTISDSETNESADSEDVPVFSSYDTCAIECTAITGSPAASDYQWALVGTCVKGGPQYGAASFSGAGNMAAAAVRRRAVNGTLSGAGNLVGLVVRRRQLLGTMSGAGTLAANVVRRRKLLGTMSGVGTFAAKAVTRRVISATASGVGTLAAKAVRRRAVLGTMSGAGTLTAKAIAKWRLLGTMSGVGSLHADATIAGKVNIKGTLSGVGTLAAKAVYRTRAVACSMSATGTLAAKATVRLRVQIAATMSGAGSLAANAVRRRPISASLSGAGTLGANAVRQRTMAATMSGAGHLSALGIKKGLIEATASMSGVGLMRAYAIFRGLGGLLYGKAMVVVMVKASGCTVQRLRGTGGLAERLDSDIHVA